LRHGLQQGHQAEPHDRVVVHEEQRGLSAHLAPPTALASGTSRLTVVPWPGREETSTWPPRTAARAAMFRRPCCSRVGGAAGIPEPSSRTSRTKRRRLQRTLTTTIAAPACRTAFEIASRA